MSNNHPLILLVDNNADNRDMYVEYLRSRGFRVAACGRSDRVLDMARSLAPDIILLELRMNGLNGLQVLARLHADASVAHVPVVALTASVLSSERAAAMAAGFTALLAKPCFPEDVAAAVTRILRERRKALTLRVRDQQPFTSTPSLSLQFELHPSR
jgi:CheY-like chemotaxis protein